MRQQVAALRSIERGLAAPFVFLGVAVAALGSVEASPAIWAGSLVLLLAGAHGAKKGPARSPGLPSLAATCFALVLVTNNISLNPAYTPAAPFNAAFLVAGSAIGSRISDDALGALGRLLAVGAGLLAVWGLWQVSGGGASRATAHFETPATLASVINFALLFVLVHLAVSVPRWPWVALGVLLAAGLASTVSRGGILALLAGLLIAAIAIRRAGLSLSRRGAVVVAFVLAAGGMLAIAANALPSASLSTSGSSQVSLHQPLGGAAENSSVSRLELYALAIEGIRAHWAAGTGYLGFRALLDANRDAVPTFKDGDTYFVHNDYLQTFLELGIGGFFAFACALLLPIGQVLRHAGACEDRPLVVAMLAAIAAMATLAMVDFPFYLPICLVLFGMAVGVLDRRVGAPIRYSLPAAPAIRRLVAIAMATAATVLLGPPLIADLAASNAHRAWRNADGQAAAYWFEVARRFEPRDWRYHWYAGQFWYAQAEQTVKPAAARLADESFAAGMAANPIEVRNHLGRIATHRRFAGLLETPAGTDTTRKWVAEAAALAPHHPGVRAELARLGSGGGR